MGGKKKSKKGCPTLTDVTLPLTLKRSSRDENPLP
jgi:hypothetical protein